ncbi:MAG: ARMT1-like domain-containing protein [Thermodesulfobacteriota bacterium]
MIFLSPECFPCLLRQADVAARARQATGETRIAIAAAICAMMRDLPSRNEIPAVTATRVQELLRDRLGTDDPFGPMKERILSRFGEMSERAARLVKGAPDPWAAAVRLSAFGNILDSGIVEPGAMEQELASISPEVREYRLPPRFRERLLSAESVGVLLDNAGEAAFDLPLLSLLSSNGRKVWIGVKGGPVYDDLTWEDAGRLGLSAFGEVVSNGNRGVGTILELCAEPFRERIAASGMILSKGQGNFETLVGQVPNAYYLLRCKCPVVSRAVGRPEGEYLLLDALGGHAE